MKFTKSAVAALLIASSVSALTGCANTGAEYGADVYAADQLNAKQETKTVKILSVLPAKVAVDNTANKQGAQVVGSILGAIAGAALGYQASDLGSMAAGAAGSVVGAVAGSAVKDKVLVDGVTLSYAEDDKVYSSTQIGKECLFAPGLAVVITTKANETRVQPNHTCPAK
ncbi:TPA: hypothetical protein ACGQ50_000801 [Enterobacter cloacae]